VIVRERWILRRAGRNVMGFVVQENVDFEFLNVIM